jgi:hypothetical protein
LGIKPNSLAVQPVTSSYSDISWLPEKEIMSKVSFPGPFWTFPLNDTKQFKIKIAEQNLV